MDVVILATPPHFRPAQLKAAIASGKFQHTASLNGFRDLCSRGIQERFGEVEIRNEIAIRGARFRHAFPLHQQGSAHGFLEDPALIEPAMLAEIKALIRGKYHDGVVR